VTRNDLTFYDRAGDGWWRDDDRAFRSLRALSEFRLDWLLRQAPLALAGARVLDLGCGGGLLALPLAARGAHVVGVDLSYPSLRAAFDHADPGASALFVRADARRCPIADDSADLVLLADVVEHLPDWASAIAEAARVLRPGGVLYVNTINRTWRARILAITVAENVGLVPRGTHDGRLFVRPAELCAAAARTGLRCRTLAGEVPSVLATLRRRAITLRARKTLAVAYAALFVKGEA
jgi:2-polyprenyl-6-hydroxyphenyl methylase/3-demethylubiquinone-9 3-methyltransferase